MIAERIMYRNLMEKYVEKAIDEYFAQDLAICRCTKCRNDIAALALNQLKPIYVSSHEGEIYSRLGEMDLQARCNLIIAVQGAIKKVASEPRHDK